VSEPQCWQVTGTYTHTLRPPLIYVDQVSRRAELR
jgi:hypothetical protein